MTVFLIGLLIGFCLSFAAALRRNHAERRAFLAEDQMIWRGEVEQ